MRQENKFMIHIFATHLFFAVTVAWLLRDQRIWIILVEAVTLVSLIYGIKKIHDLFSSLKLLRSGREFIAEGDLTSQLTETGQIEVDELIQVYNIMIKNLREQRVQTQEQNYFMEKLLSSSPSSVIILDYDENISYMNPAAVTCLGISNQAAKGQPIHNLDHPLAGELDSLNTNDFHIAAMPGGRRFRCHRNFFIDRGFRRDFYLFDELTEELHRTEKTSYEKLIRMMSHEVNNTVATTNSLLQSCLGFADQLSNYERLDYETALRTVIQRADQLNQFMSHFAEVVRIPLPEKNAVEPDSILKEVITALKSELSDRQIWLQWTEDSKLPAIPMDRAQMERVFLNILKNAMEAIGSDGGMITIRTESDGYGHQIQIEDSGPGISEAVKKRLFTPFFSSKETGQGIGLTLVREILTMHAFDFSLDSKPGHGACFTIRFNG